MNLKKSLLGAGAVAGLLTLTIGTMPANADSNVGSTTTLAAVGSDTTQDVMEGLSNSIKIAGAPAISNYQATPTGRSITTRTGQANCTFTAPKNSGEGRDALSAAMRSAGAQGSTNLAGCVDVARMSSVSNPTTSPGLGTITYIPFATDGVTYAFLPSGSVPHSLNLNDLKAIYTANTGACIFKPLIPAPGSGTRSKWLSMMGLTVDTIGAAGGWGSCVSDKDPANPTKFVQEHDGRFITDVEHLVPISTAQSIAQGDGISADIRGRAGLGAIDFTSAGSDVTNLVSPVALETSYSVGNRSVYNAVPTSALTAGSKTSTVFSGASALMCNTSSQAIIHQYGMRALNPTAALNDGGCGDTGKKNTN